MLNIRKLVKNYRETGALAEQCGIFSFINDWCFITKSGAIGAVIEVEGIDYECLDQRTLDSNAKRLEAAFRLCGPEFRVYQYLFKSHFHPDQPPAYSNPVVEGRGGTLPLFRGEVRGDVFHPDLLRAALPERLLMPPR